MSPRALWSYPGDAPTTPDIKTLKGFHIVWRRDPHLAAKEQGGVHNDLVKNPRDERVNESLAMTLEMRPHTLHVLERLRCMAWESQLSYARGLQRYLTKFSQPCGWLESLLPRFLIYLETYSH